MKLARKTTNTLKKKVMVVYNNAAFYRRKKSMETTSKTSVYILELQENKIYVGKTSNIPKRIGEHMNHSGSAFTKKFQPTGRSLERLGNIQGDGDAAERDETLRYMYLRGIDNVRGWRYTQIHMTPEQVQDAEGNIREMFDLCRKCGMPGHFVLRCKNKVDRLGNPI